VAALPFGIRMADIEAEITKSQSVTLNRRTLQRRLQKLVTSKRSLAEVKTTALVYKLLGGAPDEQTPQNTNTPFAGVAETEFYVSVSAEGARIRDKVSVPLIRS